MPLYKFEANRTITTQFWVEAASPQEAMVLAAEVKGQELHDAGDCVDDHHMLNQVPVEVDAARERVTVLEPYATVYLKAGVVSTDHEGKL